MSDTPRLPDQRLLAAAKVTAAKPNQNFRWSHWLFLFFLFLFFIICLNSAWTQRCIKTISPRRQINAEKRIITNNNVDKTFGAQSEAEIDPQTSRWPFPDSAFGASVNFFFCFMLAADDSSPTPSLTTSTPGLDVWLHLLFFFFFYRFCPSDSKLKPIRWQALAVGKDGEVEAFRIFDLEAVTDGRPLPYQSHSPPPSPPSWTWNEPTHTHTHPTTVTPLGLNFWPLEVHLRPTRISRTAFFFFFFFFPHASPVNRDILGKIKRWKRFDATAAAAAAAGG